MARTKKYSRKSQKRRTRGSKRRGQTGGSHALGYSDFTVTPNPGGASAHMLKTAGGPGQQTAGTNGGIAVLKQGQTGGTHRKGHKKKLRGGSLMDALSSAVVPLALFGMNHKIGSRLRKTR